MFNPRVIFDQLGNLYGTAREGGNLSQSDGAGCGLSSTTKKNCLQSSRRWANGNQKELVSTSSVAIQEYLDVV